MAELWSDRAMRCVSGFRRRILDVYDTLRVARLRDPVAVSFTRLGTRYGGWYVPTGLLPPGSHAICVGAGEDISFDLQLIQQCRLKVHILDPTPRAKVHVLDVLAGLRDGRAVPINHDPRLRYDMTGVDPSAIRYHEQGLWSENATMRFFSPKNPDHVSHSLTNLQNTDRYFEAECITFENFCVQEGMNRVDLLKLDVEGAEYAVLRSVLASKVLPKVICVEFDEGVHRTEGYFQRITSTIQALRGAGYLLGKVDRWNLTFLRPDRSDLALPRGKPRAVSGQSSRSG